VFTSRYHTLLLLSTNEDVLLRLPDDCSAALYHFVRRVSPFKSLEELAIDIDVSLPQVFRIALHLIAWSEAKLIHPISAPNIYVVSPAFDVELLSSAAAESFAGSFNKQRLPTVLVQFSQPRPFGEHMAPFAQSRGAVREQQLLMVQWLLRHDVLTLLHTYVFFKVPELAAVAVDPGWSATSGTERPSQVTRPPPPSPPIRKSLGIARASAIYVCLDRFMGSEIICEQVSIGGLSLASGHEPWLEVRAYSHARTHARTDACTRARTCIITGGNRIERVRRHFERTVVSQP